MAQQEKRWQILVIEPREFSNEALQVLEAAGEVTLGPFTRDELLSAVARADVLFVRLGHVIDAEILDASRARWVVTPTTGLDHIDAVAAAERNVEILSLRDHADVLEDIAATPEHTWGLLLSLVRKIPWAHQHVIEGGWQRDLFRGRDLRGMRLGLLGFGRVARYVARYGTAFGMDVVAYDPYQDDWSADVYRCEQLQELLASSDVLSIHVHLTDETRGMLDESALRHLPPHAVIVNTSRGEILDEDAVVAMLESGRLAGVAVDVLAGELHGVDSPIRHRARTSTDVLITPHIGGATEGAMARTEIHMATHLAAVLSSWGTG